MIDINNIKVKTRVRIIGGNGVYPTPEPMIGRTGRIMDRDGDLLYVVLDKPGEGDRRYWALAAELEEVPNGA